MSKLPSRIDPAWVWRSVSSRLRPGRVVGLDIDAFKLMVVVMAKRGGSVFLEDYRIRELKGKRGGVEPDFAALRGALAALVEEMGIMGLPAVSLLPFHDYFLRLITLPVMPRREAEKALLFEMKKASPYDLDSSLVDSVAIGSVRHGTRPYTSYLCLVAPWRRMAATIELMKSCGLEVKGLSVPPLSLGGLLACPGREGEEAVTVVDMSKGTMSFSLYNRRKLVFMREVPASIDNLIQSLTSIVLPGGQSVSLDYGQAEKLLCDYGIVDEGGQEGETDGGIPLARIGVMQRPVLEKILMEIQRSLDFCQEQFALDLPDRIYISGSGALLKNMRGYLSSRLHLEVEFVNPLPTFMLGASLEAGRIMRDKIELAKALGCGLALMSGRGFFAPAELLAGERKWVRSALRIAAATAAGLSVGAFLLVSAGGKKTDTLLKEKAATLANLNRFERAHSDEARSIKLVRFKRNVLLQLLGPDLPWGTILKDLSNRLDSRVELSELAYVPAESGEARVRFEALALAAGDRIENTIADMITALNSSPFFTDVRLGGVRKLKGRLAQVELDCRVVY